jgi:predicted transcriptional regulator of viral defense system
MLINYMAEYDPDTLIVYAERLGNAAVLKRLGYLCDILRLTDEPFLEQCEQRLTAGIALLDPAQAGRGDRNARWRLRVNVDFEDQATS